MKKYAFKTIVRKDIKNELTNLLNVFAKSISPFMFGTDPFIEDFSSGSFRNFCDDNIPDEIYTVYQPYVGDVDLLVDKRCEPEIRLALKDVEIKPLEFKTDKHEYTLFETSDRKYEMSLFFRVDNVDETPIFEETFIQIDLEFVNYAGGAMGGPTYPEHYEVFAHSSDWDDTKLGFKGKHHKILLNSIATVFGDKFSITHGLRSRSDVDELPGARDEYEIAGRFFSNRLASVDSFAGLVDSVNLYLSNEDRQAVFTKYKDSISKMTKTDGDQASINYLYYYIANRNYVNVVPMVGFYPVSHMGHYEDIGLTLKNLKGKSYLGISDNTTVISKSQRLNVLTQQWGLRLLSNIEVKFVKSVGETLKFACENGFKNKSIGTNVLRLVVGEDRKAFAERVRESILNRDFREIQDYYDVIHDIEIHVIKSNNKFSGTVMRYAALKDDLETFAEHIGPVDNSTNVHIMKTMKKALVSGKIKLNR